MIGERHEYESWGLGSFLKSLISISRDPCRIVGLRFPSQKLGRGRIVVGAAPGTALRHRADSRSTAHAGKILWRIPCGQGVGNYFGVLLYVPETEAFVHGSWGGADVGLDTTRAISDPEYFQNTGQPSKPMETRRLRWHRAPATVQTFRRTGGAVARNACMGFAFAAPRMRGRGAVVGCRSLGFDSGGCLWRSTHVLMFH